MTDQRFHDDDRLRQDFEAMRRAMVESQLRPNAVDDPRVVAAMGEMPRERFVPPERRLTAYVDRPIPLGQGRVLEVPMVTGRLLTELRCRPRDRALVIGAATGYAAALLAKLVARVTALEEDAAFAPAVAAANLRFVQGPLASGWPDDAPYDVILVDGGVELIPDAIVAQLGEGGRLAAALVEGSVTRLVVGVKAGGTLGLRAFADASATPLPGFVRPPVFSF